MKKPVIAFTLFLLLNIPTSNALESKKMTEPVLDLKTEAWNEAAAVGKEHKVLSKAAGSWSYTSTWWENETDAPSVSKGKSKMKMILGGRFLQQDMAGSVMGKPFEGVGLIGFDNLQEGYDVVWLDNIGTGILRSTASYDENTKVLTEVGKFSDPMSAEKVSNYTAQWKFVDSNNMTYTMYLDHNGKLMKRMEVVYKRIR
jgi:hypothetical protein